DVLPAAVLRKSQERPPQGVEVSQTPGVGSLEERFQIFARVDPAAMDGLASALLGELLAFLGQLEFRAESVQEVRGVGLVVDGEAGIDADGRPVDAEQSCPDRVEGAAPDLAGRGGSCGVAILPRLLRRL